MHKTDPPTSTPEAGSYPGHRRNVHSEEPAWPQLEHRQHATDALMLASTLVKELARSPNEGPDLSMTFSQRFYLFAFMVLLAMLGTLVVIVWMVAGAG